MTVGGFLFWLQAAGAMATPPAALPTPVAPPSDWQTLRALPWKAAPRSDAATSRYVADEIRTGRCRPNTGRTGSVLTVDVAVLAAADGRVRAIVPRAIGCPAVEQYTIGLVSRFARANIEAPGVDTWYRAGMTYSWSE